MSLRLDVTDAEWRRTLSRVARDWRDLRAGAVSPEEYRALDARLLVLISEWINWGLHIHSERVVRGE